MSDIRGLDAWMRTLSDKELPTLNTVVKEICELSDHDETRADDLTKIILRDANLTSKVLKIANSVHYNHSFTPIKTVSRGIVQLGFENLRNITLASTLIDGFLKGKPKTLLLQRLAKAFHAAVQAKALVPFLNGEHKEQVFIAALLRNIGELALLATGKENAEQFFTQRDMFPDMELSLSQEYLGVDIHHINRALIKEWSLGDLVREACENSPRQGTLARAVNLGNALAKSFDRGINSAEMNKLYEDMAKLCDISPAAARKQVIKMAEEASAFAKSYDAEVLLPELPEPPIEPAVTSSTVQTGFEFQQYINQMHKMLFEGGDISQIMQTSVTALNLGSGCPRVAIGMLDYKAKALDFRYVAGEGTTFWRQSVHIELEKLVKVELLHEFLRVQQTVWYQPSVAKKTLGVLEQLKVTGDIMLAPLRVGRRLIAILYVDGYLGKLTPKHYEEFQLVANQLNLFLKIQSIEAGQTVERS